MALVKWLPLESNPDVMNKFLGNLGVPEKWAVGDVISLDEELLSLVPRPVLAVMLLFPVGAQQEEYRKQQEEEVMAGGLTINDKIYFMKQTIRNACGTVALIHAVANTVDRLSLDSDSTLQKFLNATSKMSPIERGEELEKNEDIGFAHEVCAQEGQTETPSVDDVINLHFIALVNVGGQLYELDGRKSLPISHGPTTEDTFLQDACNVCKQFMERDPSNLNFSVMALTPASQ